MWNKPFPHHLIGALTFQIYILVPKQILKDEYDYSLELDEPSVYASTETNEIYHDDQFYKESEAIPPAPKVHGGLANVGTVNTTVGQGMTYDRANKFDDTMFEGSDLLST